VQINFIRLYVPSTGMPSHLPLGYSQLHLYIISATIGRLQKENGSPTLKSPFSKQSYSYNIKKILGRNDPNNVCKN
jgi:hypothetical protein